MGSSLCPAVVNHQLETQLLSQQFHVYKEKPYTYVTNIMKQNKFWLNSTENQINQFFQELSGKYNSVPYHNLTHGFDVMTALDKYLIQFKMINKLESNQEERIFMLIAAYAHDNGHRGLTNDFYINSDDQLAITYQYKSPLQNMHASNLLQCLRKHKITVTKQNRNLMVNMILATDNVHHSQLVRKLQDIGSVWHRIRSSETIQKQDKAAMIQVLIHTADLNSTGKELDMYLKWNARLYEEFQNQASMEKQMGLPITIRIDQNNKQKSRASSNVSFISKMVLPLFKGLCVVQQKFQYLVKNAENIKKYCQKIQSQGNK